MTPWDNVGKSFGTKVSIRQALEQADADYNVQTVPLCALDFIPKLEVTASPLRMIRRTDNRQPLGYCRKVWQPIQNSDLFGKFETLVRDDSLQIKSVGLLNDGQSTWMLASYSESFTVKSESIKPYLLISNHFDGETAVSVKLLLIRERGYVPLWIENRTVKHSSLTSGKFQADDLYKSAYVKFQEWYFNLSELCKLPGADEPEFLTQRLFGSLAGKVLKAIECIIDYDSFSLFEVYSAVCEYLTYRIGRYAQPVRLCKLWFGEHTRIISQAIGYVLHVLNSKSQLD